MALIDRQDAIDVLKRNYPSSCFEDLCKAVDLAIKALSAQPEPRWIPCSERLPEERQEILATTTDNAWGDVVIIRTYYKEMHKSVIAWMPLPEPYAERRTDDESI